VCFYIKSFKMKNNGKNICMNMKPAALLAGALLGLVSSVSPAEENHMQEALKHADLAAKATDAKAIAMHAEESQAHAKTADKHLDAGLDSLDQAIKHGNKNEGALAKKAAEEAAKHLREAR
jgi:uncharacterized protein involved in high-affinity Fe2+ transport